MTATLDFSALQTVLSERPPKLAIILGSGLGDVTRSCSLITRLPFRSLPGFPDATVVGHKGSLLLGDWAGQRVLVFEGRLHYYEGNDWRTVLLPVQTAHYLGARRLLLTNAAGGIGDALDTGCLMAITDHFEWSRPYPWRSPRPGSRQSPYSDRMLGRLQQASHEAGVRLDQGIYAMLTGPCYETPAEIGALKSSGADAVGMSTAREVECAHQLGMECAAISCITNKAAGLSGQPLNHKEVLANAAAQSGRLASLLERFLEAL